MNELLVEQNYKLFKFLSKNYRELFIGLMIFEKENQSLEPLSQKNMNFYNEVYDKFMEYDDLELLNPSFYDVIEDLKNKHKDCEEKIYKPKDKERER